VTYMRTRMTNEPKPDLRAWREEAERKLFAFSKLRLPTDLEQTLIEENETILTLLDRVENLERDKKFLINTVDDLNAQLHEHKEILGAKDAKE